MGNRVYKSCHSKEVTFEGIGLELNDETGKDFRLKSIEKKTNYNITLALINGYSDLF